MFPVPSPDNLAYLDSWALCRMVGAGNSKAAGGLPYTSFLLKCYVWPPLEVIEDLKDQFKDWANLGYKKRMT